MKRLVFFFMLSLLTLPLAVWSQRAQQQDSAIITLNAKGVRARGTVRFDHQAHQGLINPDSAWPYKAQANASCAGCHHSQSTEGLPQLWRCTTCHQTEGGGTGKFVNQRCANGCATTGNPKNCDCDELHAERAFHTSCIGCHQASNEAKNVTSAPVSCNGCHQPLAHAAK